MLFFAGFFIDALNTLWTQNATRVLGASIMSLFICMRLVSSVAGSAVLLREVPESPLVWVGMAACVVTVGGFLGVQAWDKAHQGPAAEAGSDAAAGKDMPAAAAHADYGSNCSGGGALASSRASRV